MVIIQHPPIEAYFASETDAGVDIAKHVFAYDARVTDEGQMIYGIEAIKSWRQAAKLKYQYTAELLESLESNGLVIIKVRLSGTFPGSPAVVSFKFGLADEMIKTLEIG